MVLALLFEKKEKEYTFAIPFSGGLKKGRSFDIAGGYQSGQLGQTVTLLTYVFEGSNPSPPTEK